MGLTDSGELLITKNNFLIILSFKITVSINNLLLIIQCKYIFYMYNVHYASLYMYVKCIYIYRAFNIFKTTSTSLFKGSTFFILKSEQFSLISYTELGRYKNVQKIIIIRQVKLPLLKGLHLPILQSFAPCRQ